MQTYILTMRIEAPDGVNPAQIRADLENAAEVGDLSFGLDITDIADVIET
ncbi:hypothetical protein [Streptomyces sp. NBC_01240]|nr:hypothetical protein OG466_41165 [Streptomyces sp. NBC_01240]